MRPLDMPRTAHVVIDLQNGFLAPGAAVETPAARAIVPAVNAISRAVRAAGGTNIFVQCAFGPEDRESWSYRFIRKAEIGRPDPADFLQRGTESHALWRELEITGADVVAEKTRFSAFVPGCGDLDDQLQARNLDTLIITGTLTNVCCESTARDAMQRNYRVLMVSDATAAATAAEHETALHNVARYFGEVLSTEAVIAAVAGGGAKRRPISPDAGEGSPAGPR